MRYRIKFITLVITFMIWRASGLAQTDPFIDYFQATKINTHIFLTWQLSLGNTCNGITIHRSTDSVHFNRIGLIPGICGSPTDVARYNHIDSAPVLNRRNYYQLEFGGVGVSEVIGIDVIDFSISPYQVWPNPANDKTKIFFQNDERRAHQLHLYSPQGILLLTQTTESDFYDLDVSRLPHGLYIFTVTQKGASPFPIGKILVQ